MTPEQRAAWLAFWPRTPEPGAMKPRLVCPGEPCPRGGCIPDTRAMWAVYWDIGGPAFDWDAYYPPIRIPIPATGWMYTSIVN